MSSSLDSITWSGMSFSEPEEEEDPLDRIFKFWDAINQYLYHRARKIYRIHQHHTDYATQTS